MSDDHPCPGVRRSAGRPTGLLARYWWVVGLAIAGVIAILAPLASADPDGLDSVAINQGFEEAGEGPGFQILPGYTIPGVDGTRLDDRRRDHRDRHRLPPGVPARAPRCARRRKDAAA